MNTSELKKLLKTFYRISGMEIALFDNKFHTVLFCKSPCNHYCRTIHHSSKTLNICRESDIEHFRIVRDNPELLTYTCPFGFYTAIAPIKRDGEVVAYLSFAPGIEDKKDCDLIPLEKATSMLPNTDPDIIKESISEIPHYSKEKLDSYADTLMLIAKTIEHENLIDDSEQNIAYLTKYYIDHNLSHKITLAELSYNLHCSTVTLTEHFKKSYGISIMQYVTKKRMKHAEELLSDDSLSINSIALSCGFPDVEYFSRTFKKYHGVSPSQWHNKK